MTSEDFAQCEARTRSGGSCRRPAGWGTDHAGFGTCKLHGGSTPNAGKTAARLLAESEAIKLANAATPIVVDPTEALLMTLYSAVAITNASRERFAQLLDTQADPQAVEAGQYQYEKALDRQQQYAEAAVKLGIAQKQIDMIERTGETILALLRDVLNDLDVSMERAQPVLVRRLAALNAAAS